MVAEHLDSLKITKAPPEPQVGLTLVEQVLETQSMHLFVRLYLQLLYQGQVAKCPRL